MRKKRDGEESKGRGRSSLRRKSRGVRKGCKVRKRRKRKRKKKAMINESE